MPNVQTDLPTTPTTPIVAPVTFTGDHPMNLLSEAQQARLDAQAAMLQKNLHAKIQFAKIKGDRWTWPNGVTIQTPVAVVILGVTGQNAYFNNPYVHGQEERPLCKAIGLGDDMVLNPTPSPELDKARAEGRISANGCYDCPMNKFGSATNGSGKGKACRNSLLLAIALPDNTAEGFFLLKVPPTSIRAVESYLSTVTAAMKHPVNVVTAITTTQPKGFDLYKLSTYQANHNVGAYLPLVEQALQTFDRMATIQELDD